MESKKAISDKQVLSILKGLKVGHFNVTSQISIQKPESITGFYLLNQSMAAAYQLAAEEDITEIEVSKLTIKAINKLGDFEVNTDKLASDPSLNLFKQALSLAYAAGVAKKSESKNKSSDIINPVGNQLFAIYHYAIKHGRYWKDSLKEDWLNGKDSKEEGGQYLRQVRNNFGPDWLKNFDIKKTISDGYAMHVIWESIAKQDESETSAEILISEMAVALGANEDKWWKSWLVRSDEWNAKQHQPVTTTENPKKNKL